MNLDNRFDSLVYPDVWIRCPRLTFSTSRYILKLERFSYTRPQPFIVAKHAHPFFEIHYCPSGSGILTVEGKEYNIAPGSFFITGPQTLHSQISTEENPTEEYTLLLEISPCDSSVSNAENYNLYENFDNILDIIVKHKIYFGKDKYNATALLKSLQQTIGSRVGYEVHISFYWLTLMHVLLLTAQNIQPLPKNVGYLNIHTDLNYSRQGILDNIFRGYWREMSPEIAAHKLGVSVRQLNRITEKDFGLTFKQKYMQSRLDLAPMLLTDLNILSIDEIAQKLNFSSLQYFSRSFKAVYGMSPSQYRREHMQK